LRETVELSIVRWIERRAESVELRSEKVRKAKQ
jgi:hypothetical protein